MPVTYTIGDYDPRMRSVPVTFTQGEIIFKRSVNAVLAADGSYDANATKVRVGEVAFGVEQKIELGVIGRTPIAEDTTVNPDDAPPASG